MNLLLKFLLMHQPMRLLLLRLKLKEQMRLLQPLTMLLLLMPQLLRLLLLQRQLLLQQNQFNLLPKLIQILEHSLPNLLKKHSWIYKLTAKMLEDLLLLFSVIQFQKQQTILLISAKAIKELVKKQRKILHSKIQFSIELFHGSWPREEISLIWMELVVNLFMVDNSKMKIST